MNKHKKNTSETIAAIATPKGRGGVGVIRVSGPLCKSIAEKILKKTPKPRVVNFGFFYGNEENIMDQGIALFFTSPNSFTGEDVLELHCHGSQIVLDLVLKRIVDLGARLATPGEFSKRAFLNDKIDLLQAEAIADLIDASSQKAAKMAVLSLQGEFSKKINLLADSITNLRTYVEAAIDFPEEEIDFLSDNKVLNSLEKIIADLNEVKNEANQGVLFRDGITAVIAGKPNAGKSSLLNCLSGQDVAIVTDIPGTTRDVLKEYIQIDGIPLHIIDTAGLQESSDKIEQEGIKRAWKEIEKADIVLLLVDDSTTNNKEEIFPEFFQKISNKKIITVLKNKIDLTHKKPHIEKQNDYSVIYISAKYNQGIDLLKNHLKEISKLDEASEGLFIARRRHLQALDKAHEFLLSGLKQLKENKAGELLACDLSNAHNALSEITGEFTTEDLLDKIFSSFCIGK